MSADIPTPQITPADRLGLTLCLAVILHAVLILGVTFTPPEDPKPRYEPMDIVLVQQKSKAPEEADYLAQADLEGGGESEQPERPSTPLPPPLPEPVAEVAAPAPVKPVPPPAAPEPEPEKPEAIPEPLPPPPEVAALEPEPEQVAVETPEPAPVAKTAPPEESEQPPAKTEPPAEKPDPEPEQQVAEQAAQPQPKPSAAELMRSSMKMAALSAEVQRKLKAKAERPRRTFISASTKQYKYASYMESWRAKVERVGNLNYPEEARRQKLIGSLILDVSLKPDGSVDQITIRRSSGNKVLDDAAVRIVKLAAPFAPFPDDIRKDTDILHITRTWQFLHGQRFQ